MIWKTCAVQRLACGPVLIGIAEDRLAALRLLRVGLERLLRVRQLLLHLREPVGVNAAVPDRVVRRRAAGGVGRHDAAAALVGRDQEPARRRQLRLVVEVDVLRRVVTPDVARAARAATLVAHRAVPLDALERGRADVEPLRAPSGRSFRRPCRRRSRAPSRPSRTGRSRSSRAGGTAACRRVGTSSVKSVGVPMSSERAAHVERDQAGAGRRRSGGPRDTPRARGSPTPGS